MTGRGTLSERLYKTLLASIVGGEYPEGTRLPPEKDLCTHFEVSRPVVREALGRLRSEGLIRSRKGSGSYVLERATTAPPSPSGVGSIGEIEECFDFRLRLEGENAFVAAERRTEDDLAEMRVQFEAFCEGTASPSSGIIDDFNFHLAIARATHNKFFVLSFLAVEQHVLFSINFTRRLTAIPLEQRRHNLIAEHEAILTAIEDGNGARARAAMKRHVRNSKIRIFEGRNV